MRVMQEFYCGECSGYFMVKLNMGLNCEVYVKCPSCGHEHRRVIKDGEIYESGRYHMDIKETIHTTMATFSKDPFTKKMQEAHELRSYGDRRDGVPFDPVMADRWLQVAARERGEI